MAFIKYFLRRGREKVICFFLILPVSIYGLIKGGFDIQSLIGIAAGALFVWAIGKISKGHLFIMIGTMVLLSVMMIAGYQLQEIYRNYFSGFLLGGVSILLYKEYETFRKDS